MYDVEVLPISDLIHDDINVNKGTERGQGMLEKSLQQFGAGRSILIDRNGKIIAGNKTVEQAGALGFEDVVVIESDGTKLIAVKRTDLDMDADSRARELALADNRVQQANYVVDAENLQRLIDQGVATETWWTDAEVQALLKDVAANQPPPPGEGGDDYEAAPPEGETRTRPGDIWAMGDHRLYVGDSREPGNLALLLNGAQADMMWTDPPYGVDYVGKTADALTIQNDGSDTLDTLLERAFTAADLMLKPGAPIYVAHPAGTLSLTFMQQFLARQWRLHQTLIWVKDSMVLGHSDYHYRHEPILFGYKSGPGRSGRGGNHWYGDNAQTSIFEVPRPKRSEEHPTMKPVELILRHVLNSAPINGIVLDPFGGSGSTLIACHRSRRRCYSCEIDPRYADVILARYEAETEETATLEGRENPD